MIVPASLDDWLAIDALAPAPTFFARPAWALALAHAFAELTPHPVWVGNGRERVLVPLMRRAGGRMRWREYVGMPLGTYTCALREDGTLAIPSQFERALGEIARACDALTVVPWPLGPGPAGVVLHPLHHETAVIDLSSGADVALGNFAGITRRMTGQAERRGVRCERDRSPRAAGDYYDLLRDSAERWGLSQPPYPKSLLEALLVCGGEDAEIWFARVDGQAVAGGVVVYGGEELFFWSAAMQADASRLRPSNALNAALIREGARRGMHWYNLGSSEGMPGVERFKRGLGARAIAYDELHRERAAFRLYSRVRTSLRPYQRSAQCAST